MRSSGVAAAAASEKISHHHLPGSLPHLCLGRRRQGGRRRQATSLLTSTLCSRHSLLSTSLLLSLSSLKARRGSGAAKGLEMARRGRRQQARQAGISILPALSLLLPTPASLLCLSCLSASSLTCNISHLLLLGGQVSATAALHHLSLLCSASWEVCLHQTGGAAAGVGHSLA